MITKYVDLECLCCDLRIGIDKRQYNATDFYGCPICGYMVELRRRPQKPCPKKKEPPYADQERGRIRAQIAIESFVPPEDLSGVKAEETEKEKT